MTVLSRSLLWSYGVTTVPERFGGLLQRTLESLARGGFDNPRLFIDSHTEKDIPVEFRQYDITFRCPRVRTFGNWILTAWELYLRSPRADRFAVFQDDFVTYKNLRDYLEYCEYPPDGYLNLYTFPSNQKPIQGWYRSNQLGRGAVALVFNNEALRTLLRQQHLVDRPLNVHKGWRSVDGGIVESFRKAGWREYVHNPSLVQHTGVTSSMGNKRQIESRVFRGEDFDARNLIVQQIPNKTRKHKRIGLVGYHCPTGLGELNRQIAAYVDVDKWLIKPHRFYRTLPSLDVVDTTVCQSGSIKVEEFVRSVDVVVFCEVPLYPNLLSLCKKYNRKTVCIPMQEWMPSACRGWPESVDLFVCPTKQSYTLFSHLLPCIYFPWPVDTERYKYKHRETCERFVFINGTGGYKGRKGADTIVKLLRTVPDLPITIFSQETRKWPKDDCPNLTVRSKVSDNYDLYNRGSVLIAPHSVDGLGLEPMEAMACGMPVITTDGAPWNEIPALARIPARIHTRTVRRPVDWYLPDDQALAEICKNHLNKDINEASKVSKEWSQKRSWCNFASKLTDIIRYEDVKAVPA